MLASLGEAAIRTLLLASAVQGVVWLLRVRHVGLLLAAWTMVLAASMAMPMAQHVTPLQVPIDPALPGSILDGASGLLPWPAPRDVADPGGSDLLPAPSPVRWTELPYLAVIYLVVAAGILLRVALGIALSVRLLFRAVAIQAEWTGGVRVRISRDVTGPVTIANVIVLPPDAPGWPDETRRAVLAHEQAHVERWDFAWLVLSQVNRGLFWFSPVPWWLHRRLVALTELASDDRAIACVRDRFRYAEILLEMGRRSGPISAGPAMARPATLSRRIDRILLQQAPACPAARSQQALLTAGVAGLSLAVASTIPNPVPHAVGDPFADRWDASDIPAQPSASLQARDAPSGVPGAHPPDAAPAGLPQAAAKAQQLPGRRASRTVSRTTAPAPRVLAKAVRGIADQGIQTGEIRLPEPITDGRTRPAPDAGGPTPGGTPAVDLVQLLPSHGFDQRFPMPPLPRDFQGIMGSTCAGTVAIGPNAASSPDRQPWVVPGQKVAARAQFHLRTNGTAWVRFDAFGQRPLELPLRFTRNGMTWTGEYGIAYTVQASGEHSLTGLASFFRNDSARLDFICAKPATDFL